MVYQGEITGRYVNLRSVTEKDAEFTLAVRQNCIFDKHLPRLNINLEQQTTWIKLQRQKDGDYFFVVWNKDDDRIGTIGIYNIKGDQAEAGRLTMQGNAFQSLEAQLLSFRFAFDNLNLSNIVSYIYADNARAIRFTKQFGGILQETCENEDGRLVCKAINTKETFQVANSILSAMLYR